MNEIEFIVTDDHLKLLRRAYVSWNDCEFGAPSIDCKRPYGNSSVYEDMAGILGITPPKRDGDFSGAQESYMQRLHDETRIVLQIILSTGQMKAGKYIGRRYGLEWEAA